MFDGILGTFGFKCGDFGAIYADVNRLFGQIPHQHVFATLRMTNGTFMMTNGVVRVTNWVVGINKSIIEKSVIIGNKYFQRVTFLYYTASQYD